MTDSALTFLLDTNILLRLGQVGDPDHAIVSHCVSRLLQQRADLVYTSQNLGEFWNVCTRPTAKNGFGESIAEADRRARLLEGRFRFLPDGEATHREWRRILVENGVSGVQVHDARLVAAMRVHGIRRLLTLNTGDFRRYAGIVAESPASLLKML